MAPSEHLNTHGILKNLAERLLKECKAKKSREIKVVCRVLILTAAEAIRNCPRIGSPTKLEISDGGSCDAPQPLHHAARPTEFSTLAQIPPENVTDGTLLICTDEIMFL